MALGQPVTHALEWDDQTAATVAEWYTESVDAQRKAEAEAKKQTRGR